MKTSKKILTIVLSFCMALIVGILAACDEGTVTTTDYSTWNYGDYDAVGATETAPEGTEGYWDYWETKEISYQFRNDSSGAENHGFANYFPTLLNLYKDGTLKAWQRCILIPSMFDPMTGATEEQTEYNTTYKLLVLFYGYWELDEATNEITVYVQNSVDYEFDGEEVKYKSYTFSATPVDGKISFYFDVTESGQAIKSLMTSNLSIQYSSYANFAQGITVEQEAEQE